MTMKSLQLKNQDTGFFDPETELKVLRDQVVGVDMEKKVGRMTTRAIRSGRLIEVNLKPTTKQASGAASQESGKSKSDDSDLPEDFPARPALIAGGFDSLAKVTAASDDELTAVKGVGAATVEKIRAAL